MSSGCPRLAIIIPTYRFNAIAQQALTSAAAIACDDILVHIGDNSANPEKHAFLHDLARRSRNLVVTCHRENIGAEANWLGLVRSQTASLICMAADDDAFCGAYFVAGAAILSSDAGCAAASGLLLSVAEDPRSDMPSLFSPAPRVEPDALARLRAYSNQNAIAYAVMRTPLVRAFADYVEQNPLKGAFNDYLLAFHLLSIGTYRLDRSAHVYTYNNDAWHLPHAAVASGARFYTGCGLPEGFAYFARLHWAVANAHFFRSTFRDPDLSNEMADKIATYLFDRLVKEFREEVRPHKRQISGLLAHDRNAAEAFRLLRDEPQGDARRIFQLFARLVAAFHPDLASRYHGFLDATLVPELAQSQTNGSSLQTQLRRWSRR